MRLSTSLRLNAQKGLVTPYDPTLTLSLQFATRQAYVSDFGPLPTFTNATTTARTFVGSDGLLKTAGLNVPRIEFDPVTRQCLGLLIEEQRTNLCPRSEEFSDASWSKYNATVSANAGVAPDGATTADLVYPSVTGSLTGQCYRAIASGISSGNSVSVSCFVKAAGKTFAYISPIQNSFSPAAYFNLSTGAVTNVAGGVTASIKQFPNGWWRITATSTAGVGPYYVVVGSTDVAGSTNNTVSGTDGILAWGAQVEVGAFASSYIPTTTTSLVRSADVCSITGAAFTGFYNQTEGAVALKYVRPTTANCTALAIDDTTVNERMLSILNSGVERLNVVDGANASSLDRTAGAINTVIGHAYRYKNLDFAFSVNGLAVVTSITQTVPTPSQMAIGNRQNSIHLNGHIHTLQYFNAIKTNAQLQALSTP